MPYNPNAVWGSRENRDGRESNPAEPLIAPDPNEKGAGGPLQPAPAPAPSGDHHNGGPSFISRHGLGLFSGAIALVIALALIVFYLLLPATAPNISVTFSNPGTITMGEPFPLTVTVANESKSVLQNAELTITLPDGLSFVGGGTTPDQRALMESIGTLSSQTADAPITIQVIATGDGGSSQTITTALTYGTTNTASTQFQSNAQTSIAVGTQSALALNYSAPSSIFSGQNFALTVNYANETGQTLSDVQLKMQYPPAYHFSSSENVAPADIANTTWNLGDLPPNATGTLVINGNIVGPANAQYQLNGSLGATFDGQNYQALTAPANFAVAQSPLSFSLTLNNSSSYVSKLGDSLDYTLSYTNNSNVTFQSVSVQARLSGVMYDLSSLNTAGAFNSKNDTITWYTANTPALAAIAPGQTGSVTFTINTKNAFPITKIDSKDYSLGVNAEIASPTVPPNTAGSSTVSVASLKTPVGGALALSSEGFVKETTVPSIKNSGPFPPKVDQPTTYTIHWTLTNYATNMENVTLSAYLQSGTTFTGEATSSVASSTPIYNAATGLVTWTIPFIPATAGVIAPPAEAVFQVSNTPAVNQVNEPVTLLGQTSLTATDVFTNSTFTESAPPITTQLSNDPSVSGIQGAVTQ